VQKIYERFADSFAVPKYHVSSDNRLELIGIQSSDAE